MSPVHPLHPSLDPECFDEPSARDERFTIVDLWDECAKFPDGDPEKKQEFLHRQMNEEIAVLENAARSLAEFPDLPWELRMWLARQSADEARHGNNYRRLFLARGGRIGQYPVLSFQYRILGKVRNIVGRLAVQNRTFEADGLDAVTHAITEAREEGDHALAAMYDAQQADEVVHIRFANEWIKRLVTASPAALLGMGRAVSLAARGFKQVFQPGGGTRVHKYAVADDIRAEAGFTTDEISVARGISEARRERVRQGVE